MVLWRGQKMNDYRLELKLSEMEKAIVYLKDGVDIIKERVTSDDELWDNADLVRNWHVSERTLATWRSRQLIDYAKIGKKIYYSKDDREKFMNKYHANKFEE